MVKQEVLVRLGNKDPLVVGDTVFNSSNVWDLTEKELEKARVELGESEDKKRRYLQELKSRLSKEGNYRLDDSFLVRFLRLRKYDLEKAYQNVKNYYNILNSRKEWFDLSDHSSLKTNFMSRLPYADEEGRIIFWVDVASWDPRETSYAETLKCAISVTEIDTMNPKCQVNGIVGIWDMKGLSVRHATEAFRKNHFMAIVSVATGCAPWRVKKLLLPNCGPVARFFWTIVRPLLTQKIRERVFLLGSDYKELHQHVNLAILPEKLGGTLKDDLCQDRKPILDNIPFLE